MERSRMTRWSAIEDQIVVDCVKEIPSNLGQAYKKAATLLPGRTESSVAQRYHSSIRNKVPVLALGSNSDNFIVNTKNTMSQLDNAFFNAKLRDDLLINTFESMPKEALIQFFMDNISKDEKALMFKRVTRTLNKVGR
jgi:hypothetical protein